MQYHQILIKPVENTMNRDGETRFRFYAVKAFPYSAEEDSQMLLKRMNTYKQREEMMMD